MERITGDTIDISEWIDFEFYDLCWYWNNQHDTKEPNIGRWLGVSHRIGSALCYWVLTMKGQVLARTTVQHMTEDDVIIPEIQESIKEFHRVLERSIGSEEFITDLDGMDSFVNDDINVNPNIEDDVLN